MATGRSRLCGVLAVALLATGAVGCSDSADETTTDGPATTAASSVAPVEGEALAEDVCPPPANALTLTAARPPLDLAGIEAAWYPDIAYDTGPDRSLDIFVPDAAGPTPLAVFIHGGGFTGGDKASAYTGGHPETVLALLEGGVAVASINYDLLSAGDPDGVIRPMTNSARAVQFLRRHHDSFDIDPERVAVWGSSAGAGTSLWLGTHEDLADPDADDPVLCHSSRPVAIGALATQATYNLPRWEEVLDDLVDDFVPEVIPSAEFEDVVAFLGEEQLVLSFGGMDSFDDIETPEGRAYLENVDMLGLMDADDAPIFVQNWPGDVADLLGFALHHPLHARAVHERAEEVGLEIVAYYPDEAGDYDDPTGETIADFLLRHLTDPAG